MGTTWERIGWESSQAIEEYSICDVSDEVNFGSNNRSCGFPFGFRIEVKLEDGEGSWFRAVGQIPVSNLDCESVWGELCDSEDGGEFGESVYEGRFGTWSVWIDGVDLRSAGEGDEELVVFPNSNVLYPGMVGELVQHPAWFDEIGISISRNQLD